MTHYLHEEQREAIRARQLRWLWRTEFPTWCVIMLVWGGWISVVVFWSALGIWLATPLLVLLTTGYMSLQHELIHGHPTRWPRVNQLFGQLPIAVWYPWRLYRDSHLQHHRNEHLTVPDEDPETYYYSAAQWQRFPRLLPLVARVRNTLPGRVLFGPLLDITGTTIDAVKTIRGGDRQTLAMWVIHALLLSLVACVLHHFGVPLLWYLLAVSYPALSLTKVRSFYEHRAAENPAARSTLNEAGVFWRLLFLNLNYHLVHHDLPGLPWYGLREVYLADRDAWQARSEGYVVPGYGTWFTAHFIAPVNVGLHPFAASHRSINDSVIAHVPVQSRRRYGAVAATPDTHPNDATAGHAAVAGTAAATLVAE